VRRRRIALAALALVTGLLLATNVVVLTSPPTNVHARRPDCALVLGAGVAGDGQPSQVLEDRLERALALFRAHEVERILVSGDHRTHAYDEPNTMRSWLEARGVPPCAIFMDHAGTDTYSSVWRARHVFGAERIIVVTQRFHLPRALWLARSLGMDADGAAADRRLYRGAVWFELREVLSRTKAVIDSGRGRRPRHAGPRIPLDGDGRATAG
jgi:SanA protein